MDAKKVRYSADDLGDVFAGATKVIVAKGKKRVEFDMKNDPPSAEDLAAAVLGPSGNLRAPTVRLGKTVLVGFGEDMYAEAL